MSLKWMIPLAAVWALAAWGALSLEALPGEFGQGWCGPWGCYPPPQALAAMHLFWVVMLLPAVAWALASGPPGLLRFLGGLMFLGSGLAMVVLAGRDLLSWLPTMPPEYRGFWVRRALYTIVMLSDVPLIQIFLAGTICWGVGWQKRTSPAPIVCFFLAAGFGGIVLSASAAKPQASDEVPILRDIAYREGPSKSWRLDLAIYAVDLRRRR